MVSRKAGAPVNLSPEELLRRFSSNEEGPGASVAPPAPVARESPAPAPTETMRSPAKGATQPTPVTRAAVVPTREGASSVPALTGDGEQQPQPRGQQQQRPWPTLASKRVRSKMQDGDLVVPFDAARAAVCMEVALAVRSEYLDYASSFERGEGAWADPAVREKAESELAALRILAVIPEPAFGAMRGSSAARDAALAESLEVRVRKALSIVAHISGARLGSAFSALYRLYGFLRARGQSCEAPEAADLRDFVEAVARDAEERAKVRSEFRRAKKARPQEAAAQVGEGEMAEEQGAPHERRGQSLRRTLRTELGVASANFALGLPLEHNATKFSGGSRRGVPYVPLTPGFMLAVERAVVNPDLSEEMRASCAGLVLLVMTSSRGKSAERTVQPMSLRGEGGREMVAAKSKHPRPRSMCPQLATAPDEFLVGTRDWLVTYDEFHAGGIGLVRATRYPGRPDRGGGFRRRGLRSSEISKLIRTIAQKVVKIPRERTRLLGISSARKFMPTIAAAQGRPETEILDLGRWSGSWVKHLNGLSKRALEDWQAECRNKNSVRPYVQEGLAARTQEIMRACLSGVRALIDAGRGAELLVEGGFAGQAWRVLHAGPAAPRGVEEVWPARASSPPRGDAATGESDSDARGCPSSLPGSPTSGVLVPETPPRGSSGQGPWQEDPVVEGDESDTDESVVSWSALAEDIDSSGESADDEFAVAS